VELAGPRRPVASRRAGRRRAGWIGEAVRAGVRPVALDTAVLSMAGLEPSRKELNILGFSPPRLACSSLRPQYFHNRLRRRLREVRQPFMAAASRRHVEARGGAPVDQFADQRRLVAIGQAVDHAGFGGTLGPATGPRAVWSPVDRHMLWAVAAKRCRRSRRDLQPGLWRPAGADLANWSTGRAPRGFDVTAAGRGHKWLPHFRAIDAETVWKYWASREQRKARRAEPQDVQFLPRRLQARHQSTAVSNATA